MILTHGANSMIRGGGDSYILDNFVALYNGVTDSGYAINEGSFGQLLWDANGPIQAPNGRGMPYYARANFSGANGGVQCINDSLKSILSTGIFTIDFWYRINFNKTPNNKYIIGIYNSDLRQSVVQFKSASTGGLYKLIQGYTMTNSSEAKLFSQTIIEGWNHVAFVRGASETKAYINGIETTTNRGIVRNDMNTIRFRFAGEAADICIAQFALRDYAVWTSDFTPPTLLYKQI